MPNHLLSPFPLCLQHSSHNLFIQTLILKVPQHSLPTPLIFPMANGSWLLETGGPTGGPNPAPFLLPGQAIQSLEGATIRTGIYVGALVLGQALC